MSDEELIVKCWRPCTPSGCPGHRVPTWAELEGNLDELERRFKALMAAPKPENIQ